MKSGVTKSKTDRPVEVRATRTRNLILKAGLDAILGGGLQGFTANELMRRTGLSKGALFHHFQSLDDIAIECAQRSSHLLKVESQADLKQTLEHMLLVPYAYKRSRALSALLFFLCERGRESPRFRKMMSSLNAERISLVKEALKEHCPNLSSAKLETLTVFVHDSHMGIAGPAGECMSSADRVAAWSVVVDASLRLAGQS